jgi:hypothetical protein
MPIAFTLLGSLAACSAGSDAPQPREPAGSTQQADVVPQRFSMSAEQFTGITQLMHVSNCTLQIDDGDGFFTPSAEIAQAEFPDNPDPQAHRKRIHVDPFTIPMPDPFPATQATLTSLSMSNLTVSMGDEELDVDMSLQGLVLAPVPFQASPIEVHLEQVLVHVPVRMDHSPTLVFDGTGLTVSTQWSLSGCFAGGWCDDLLAEQLPDLNAKIHDALLPILVSSIQDPPPPAAPSTHDAVVQVLTAFTNQVGGGQPWTLTPGLFFLFNGQADWTATHLQAPLPVTGCAGYRTCGNGARVHCEGQNEHFGLYLWKSWWKVADADGTFGTPVILLDPQEPSFVTSVDYRVCATNAAGSACFPDPIHVALDPTPCDPPPPGKLWVTAPNVELAANSTVGVDVKTYGWANADQIQFQITSPLPAGVTAAFGQAQSDVREGYNPWVSLQLTSAQDPPPSDTTITIQATYPGKPAQSTTLEIIVDACEHNTCAHENATCGTYPDWCGGTISCGDCGAGLTCNAGTCGPPPACVPRTCSQRNAQCGATDDGCGNPLDCGTCTNGNPCTDNRCCPKGQYWNPDDGQCERRIRGGGG